MKKVYIILYQDLWLKTCKVSQEGYKTLEEAQAFCNSRLGVKPKNDYEYYTIATQEKYTIVEVTV